MPDPGCKRVRFVSKKAAYWFVRSMDEPTMDLSDQHRFVTWLRRSPDNVAETLRISVVESCLARDKLRPTESEGSSLADELDASPNTSQQHEHASTNESFDEDREKTLNAKTAPLWKLAAAAAGMALTILLAIAAMGSRIDDTVSTVAGQREHITLPDGSVTHMGASTRLKIEFSGERRVVHLYQGEAVFEVAADSARPFTVTTPLIDVTAVGTRFGVSLDSGVTATVSEGEVRITDHANPDNGKVTMLRAGEQLQASDNAHTEPDVAPVDATRALEWANGWLTFDGQTIGEAAMEFNRHNVVQIEIDQPAIAALPVGYYRFKVDSPARFAWDMAANNDLAVIEDRSGEVMRLRLSERHRQ